MEKIINHTFQGKRIYYMQDWADAIGVVQTNDKDGYRFYKSDYPHLRDNPVAVWKPSSIRLRKKSPHNI